MRKPTLYSDTVRIRLGLAFGVGWSEKRRHTIDGVRVGKRRRPFCWGVDEDMKRWELELPRRSLVDIMYILFSDTEPGQGSFDHLIRFASKPVMSWGRGFVLWGAL